MPQFPLKIKLHCFAIAGVRGMPAMDALGHSRSHAHYGGCTVFASRNGGSADPNSCGIFASFKSTIKVLMVLLLAFSFSFCTVDCRVGPKRGHFQIINRCTMGTESLYHCLHYSTELQQSRKESRKEPQSYSEESQNFVDFSILLNSKY